MQLESKSWNYHTAHTDSEAYVLGSRTLAMPASTNALLQGGVLP